MERRPTDIGCSNQCCSNGLKKLIRGGLLRGSNSYDAVFILRPVTVDEAIKFVSDNLTSYPSRMVTHLWRRLLAYVEVHFLSRIRIEVACGQLID